MQYYPCYERAVCYTLKYFQIVYVEIKPLIIFVYSKLELPATKQRTICNTHQLRRETDRYLQTYTGEYLASSLQLVTFQQMINKRAWFKYYLLELRMISGSVNSIIASTVDMLLCTRGSQLAASCRLTHYKSFTVTRSRAEQSRGAGVKPGVKSQTHLVTCRHDSQPKQIRN